MIANSLPTDGLADRAARDRIERRLDETLFVEAGAGTGKTHELVQRIVNLLASGEVRADEIAAITFTERAAAELYDRVLEELDRRAQAETDPRQQALFSEAAARLDHAAIETLHAFAGRILRLHLIETGLPPDFQIFDETESWIQFGARWRRALDEILEDDSLAESLLALFDVGVELSHLEGLARKLHDDWDRALSDDAVMMPVDYDLDHFLSGLQRAIDAMPHCDDHNDTLYIRLTELEVYHDELHRHRDEPGRLARLLAQAKPSFKVSNVGRKNLWGAGQLQKARALVGVLDQDRVLLRGQIMQAHIAPVYNALRQFVLDYADERRRFGALDFQDLLVRACRLLDDHTAVAAALQTRFKRLLIDEFQDNDPLQTRIIDRITNGQPGRAFFVGDPKQSIYRFRRADIQQFNSVKRTHQAGLTQLSQNFRSTPGVTEFVNAVFEPLMRESGEDQAEWVDLYPVRERLDESSPAVSVIGDDSSSTADHASQVEADALSRMIADVVHAHWQIYDKPGEVIRDARYGDTAVLVPARRALRHLLPALEQRSIPYRLESRSLVYHSPEVRDLLNLLQAIDDPTDQVALVSALHARTFACADDDLYRWRRAGGHWDYRHAPPVNVLADNPVAESIGWLRNVAKRRWEMSVSELVGLVIRELRLMELAVLERQPRERWARYRFLHDQARAFCDAGGSSLGEFLAWAKRQADADTRVIESIVPEVDHDAVRIMTVHAAKGLEFPIVFFAGLNATPRNQAPPLLWAEDGQAEAYLRTGVQTVGFADEWEREQALIAQERVRRNYVGATRARDHLIISLYRKQSKKEEGTDAARIDRVVRTVTPPCRSISQAELPNPPRPDRATQQPTVPPEQALAARERWIARRATVASHLESLPHESATGVRRLAAAHSAQSTESTSRHSERDDSLPPWRRGRAGTAIGRATHAVLQVVDLEHPDEAEIRNTARAQATAEALSGEAAASVARLSLRAVRSAVAREAVASRRYWRELYAAVEIEGVLLDGYVDLLYELPNGDLVVVDYKTDALQTGEALDEAVARYRLQAASYALILEASLKRRVERCILLFLEPNQAREVPQLRDVMSEVRELLHDSVVRLPPLPQR